MKNYIVFWREEDHKALEKWWHGIQEFPGHRAQLRRAENPASVLLCTGFLSLYKSMGNFWKNESKMLSLAAVAGILAHVNGNYKTQSFAAQCANSLGFNKPIVSELRFSKLLKSKTLDDLYIRMIRIVKMLDGKANIVSIADSVFCWSKEMIDGEKGDNPNDRILVRLGMDYFLNKPQDPENNESKDNE